MGVLPLGKAPVFAGCMQPIEAELGCADAEFLFQRTHVRPDALLIGIEIRREMVRRVNRRAENETLGHVQAIFAHLHHDLPALFEPGQVERFFVNFPDPWFKKNQHKRRVVQVPWVHLLVDLLKDHGELFFQSDVFELALEAMAVFEQIPSLVNVCGPWSFLKSNPYQARSLREIRVEEKGLPVWRILYHKRQEAR